MSSPNRDLNQTRSPSTRARSAIGAAHTVAASAVRSSSAGSERACQGCQSCEAYACERPPAAKPSPARRGTADQHLANVASRSALALPDEQFIRTRRRLGIRPECQSTVARVTLVCSASYKRKHHTEACYGAGVKLKLRITTLDRLGRRRRQALVQPKIEMSSFRSRRAGTSPRSKYPRGRAAVRAGNNGRPGRRYQLKLWSRDARVDRDRPADDRYCPGLDNKLAVVGVDRRLAPA